MSTKSKGTQRELTAAKRQIKALSMLIGRMDKGALAIRDIALMYGSHREGCTGGDLEGVCTCQWAQAVGILKGEITPAQAPGLLKPVDDAPAQAAGE